MMKKILALVGTLILLLTALYPFVVKFFHPQLSDQGLFGDSYGMLNALFSGLAFVGLIWAIVLQKEELSLQREELAETRREFSRQSAIFTTQSFESTFFKLLEQKTTERTNVQYGWAGSTHQGHMALKDARRGLKEFRNTYARESGSDPRNVDMAIPLQSFLGGDGGAFLPLLRLYKQTLLYIEKHSSSGHMSETVASWFYVDLYKKLLTQAELALFFYYVYYTEEGAELKDFIKRTNFFSGLNKDYLVEDRHIEDLDRA